MNEIANNAKDRRVSFHSSQPLSATKFFWRYPIFLLVFGPPQFKSPLVGVDTSQAHFSVWNVIQVAWLAAIALRAILRLALASSTSIPKPVRSILRGAALLGLLFMLSVLYSPGRVISAEYCVLYFLNLVCIVEFIADASLHPPNWLQCALQLRLVAILLVTTVILTAFVFPSLVLQGGRLVGGSVAATSSLAPLIAITSAFTFLYSLEPRLKAFLLFLFGLGSTLATQTRGAEVILALILGMILLGRSRNSKRFAYLAVSSLVTATLLVAIAIASIGWSPIWSAFNRGQDSTSLTTASGRTGVWEDQLAYCISHPLGMGYIAGVRAFHRRDYSADLHAALTNIGGTDNSCMEVLTDAGWLAVMLYLGVLFKTTSMARRLIRSPHRSRAGYGRSDFQHGIRCALFLLLFCFLESFESSMYAIPMTGPFYCQNILIAVILAASASSLIASRRKLPFQQERQCGKTLV